LAPTFPCCYVKKTKINESLDQYKLINDGWRI
jgi:hypothetical protein